MKRMTKIFIIAIAIAALAISIGSAAISYLINSSLDYHEHVIELSALSEESDTTESLTESGSAIVLTCNGTLDFTGSTIALTKNETSITVEIPSGVGGIEYDGTTDYFQTDNGLTVQLINATDLAADSTSRFKDTSNSYIICGQKKVTDDIGISVTYEVGEEYTDEDIAAVESILSSVKIFNGEQSATLQGEAINPNYLSSIVFAGESVSFSNGENAVIVTTYDGSLTGASFDNSLPLTETLTASYSNIMDADTGYIPYIIETDNGKIKLLATSNEILTDFFTTPETTEAEEATEDTETEESEEPEEIEQNS